MILWRFRNEKVNVFGICVNAIELTFFVVDNTRYVFFDSVTIFFWNNGATILSY
jgi:hypothetical protein